MAERRFIALPSLGPQEGQQVGIEPPLVRAHEAVGRSWIDLQGRVLDDLRGEEGRVTNRHDLVVVAVEDERRHVEFLEIRGEIRLGKRLDAEVRRREAGHHALAPE